MLIPKSERMFKREQVNINSHTDKVIAYRLILFEKKPADALFEHSFSRCFPKSSALMFQPTPGNKQTKIHQYQFSCGSENFRGGSTVTKLPVVILGDTL